MNKPSRSDWLKLAGFVAGAVEEGTARLNALVPDSHERRTLGAIGRGAAKAREFITEQLEIDDTDDTGSGNDAAADTHTDQH